MKRVLSAISVALFIAGVAFGQTYDKQVKMDSDTYIFRDRDKIIGSNDIATVGLDISGTPSNSVVVGLQGSAIPAPGGGDVGKGYEWNGAAWILGTGGAMFSFSVTVYTDGSWDGETNPLAFVPLNTDLTVTNVRVVVYGGATDTLTFNVTMDGTNIFTNDINFTTTVTDFGGQLSNQNFTAGSQIRQQTLAANAETGTVISVMLEFSGTRDTL